MSEDYFDWVKARSDCSLFSMFEKLKLQLRQDVTKRQILEPRESGRRFNFIETGLDASVTAEGLGNKGAVSFHLMEGAIEIVGSDGIPNFKATVTLSANRECKLMVNNEERESWQVRQMALEHLFFRDN